MKTLMQNPFAFLETKEFLGGFSKYSDFWIIRREAFPWFPTVAALPWSPITAAGLFRIRTGFLAIYPRGPKKATCNHIITGDSEKINCFFCIFRAKGTAAKTNVTTPFLPAASSRRSAFVAPTRRGDHRSPVESAKLYEFAGK